MGAPIGTGWSDDRTARLKKLVDAGFSASEIAQALGGGITRNAVVAKCFREGLRLGLSPASSPRSAVQAKARRDREEGVAPADPKPKAPAKPKAPPRPVVTREAPASGPQIMVRREHANCDPAPALPLPALRVVHVPGDPKPLLALAGRDCRWPVNDGDHPEHGFMFCAARKEGDGPYCADHARLAKGRPFTTKAPTPDMTTPRRNGRGFGGLPRSGMLG